MSKRKSEYSLCPNCHGSYADGRSMSVHRLSCQTMLTTWDSFPQGEQNNARIASEEGIQKTLHQQLKSAAAERTNTNKSEDLTLRCQTSSMPSLAQLASNVTDSNFTEYVFPDALADPVPAVDAREEINLSEEPDAKIKYHGQLTPALLYQIHMEYKIRGHREVDLCLSDDIHAVFYNNMLKMGSFLSQ